MNATTLSRIQTFRKQILLPTLENIKECLQGPQQRVLIAYDAKTGIAPVDVMLQQMHSGKRYLTQGTSRPLTDTESSTLPQAWIGDSVYVDILQASETEPICIGQYCLSLEFRIMPVESSADQIQTASIIGSIHPGVGSLQLQRRLFEADQHPLELEEIDQTDIASHFIESWEVFEARIPVQEAVILSEPTIPPIPEPDLSLDPIESDPVQPFLTLDAQPAPHEISPESASDPDPAPKPAAQPAEPILTPPQQLHLLKQKAIELSQQLAPSPHSPLSCHLNPELPTSAQIIALRDQYNRVVNLSLAYSPTITEPDLHEQLQRLGHYQHLDHLANQRRLIEDQMQDWLKLYGQPSPGAIAHTLKAHITQQSKTLYHHLYTLAESCLNPHTAQSLQTDLEQATAQQHHEKTLLDALAQNPILGYLDASLLKSDTLLDSVNPFTDSQPMALAAQFIRRKGNEPNNSLMLTHIAACQSEAYQLYRQRFPDLPPLHLAIRYTLSQKLYPNRSVFVGPATKAVTLRLELWWDGTVDTAPTGCFTQIWQLFPALPTHPTQCLLITATRETQKLKTIALADGRIAQEGTKAYLWQALRLMSQAPDASTCALGEMVSEAVEQSRMRWVHLHQTEDLETGEPRDIVQLQFQLSELR